MEKTNEPIEPDLVAETANLLKRPNPRARASVRTTFRLSAEALEGLEWLAGHSGITKKDTIDELCEWLDVLNKDTFLKLCQGNELLKKLSEEHGGDLVRKTHVISDRTRRTLEKTAKDYEMSRDDLLENLILIVKLLIEKSEEERLSKHRKALEMIKDFQTQAEDFESELHTLLGDDDPIYERFGFVIIDLDNIVRDIEKEQKDGSPIDPW